MRRARKYKFRTKPWRHQRRALEKLLRMGGGALFMDVGTGKTKVYIDFACGMEKKKGVQRALVLSTKSVIEGVWPKELRTHVPEDSKLEWELSNYESVIQREFYHEDGTFSVIDGTEWFLNYVREKPTVLICDEGHKFKNPTTKTAIAIHQLGTAAVATVVGTGTPIAKWHLDLFSIFKAIDSSIFGTSWFAFKKLYSRPAGYGGFNRKAIRRKALIRAIKPWTFRIKKSQCLDLPPVVHEAVQVVLSKSASAYEQMAREAYLEIQEAEIEADNVLTRLIRLSQLTSGYVRDEHGGIHWVGTEKATGLFGLLQSLRESDHHKLAIFCREKPELRLAGLVARKAGFRPIYFHGGTSNRDLPIADFHESEEPVCFVAQISTGVEGIDLTCASEAIVWHEPDSLIIHTQLEGRFHRASDKWERTRKGQWVHKGSGKANRVTIYHLLAKLPDGRETVDGVKFVAMQKKIEVAQAVLNHPDVLYRDDPHD
jgi:SNF2 family DNA or RNA helicase